MFSKMLELRNKKSLFLIGFDKKALLSIKKHFDLSTFQIILLIWIKGIWTGILISLVVHYFISQ